ncbi:hypothetical protein COOONC_02022 [Cooperia oncophora]
MHRFPLDFTTVLVFFILSWAAATSPTAPTEPPVGPCATVRCGFNTQCFEFNGMARCYNTTCPPGEVFSECSSYCEPTCIPQNIAIIPNHACGPQLVRCSLAFRSGDSMANVWIQVVARISSRQHQPMYVEPMKSSSSARLVNQPVDPLWYVLLLSRDD